MGNNYVRYKAEVDFDGRELTRSYLDSQDLDNLLLVCISVFYLFFKTDLIIEEWKLLHITLMFSLEKIAQHAKEKLKRVYSK